MKPREGVLSALLIFLVALAVRAHAASLIVFPQPEDTAYYVGVARNLLEGRGLVTDALWSYGTPPLVVPRAAFEVWLPLPTFLAAIPMVILVPTFDAAQISFVVVGAIVPVLAWRLAADVAQERGMSLGRSRTLAIGTGLGTAVYLPLVLHSALPDSTVPFGVLTLGACLLMARLVRAGGDLTIRDAGVIGLGVILGVAAWTRNEAAWLALTWVLVALVGLRMSLRRRLAIVVASAAVAVIVFAPWAVRNVIEFGSPLPAQAATNALSLDGRDIFAWSEEPTVSRYLAAGPARLLELRVTGILHNLLNVLVLLGVPVSVIGLAALPWQRRAIALRPLLLFSVITFLVTSLVFPVSTTWGTFLHAAGAIHVLLVLCCLLALDALIVRVGRIRRWTRPVAWLGPTLAIFGSGLFTLVMLPTFAAGSRDVARQYAELPARLAAAGTPLMPGAPVISNFPVWVAETGRVPALALPDEPPASVLDLARSFPGTRLVIIDGEDHQHWPADIDANVPGSECFREVDLGATPVTPGPPGDPLERTRVFEVVCP